MWCRLPNQDLPFLLNYHICLFDFKVLLYSCYIYEDIAQDHLFIARPLLP